MGKMIKENEAVKVLLDSGLLFEINRHILHPLGFALAVSVDDNGNHKFDGLWDNRDDVEGMIFSEEVLVEGTKKYTEYMKQEGYKKFGERYKKLGFLRQEHHIEDVVVKDVQESKEKLFGE